MDACAHLHAIMTRLILACQVDVVNTRLTLAWQVDVVKTRLTLAWQVDVVKTRLMTGGDAYSGIITTFKTILTEEGAGTLMKVCLRA